MFLIAHHIEKLNAAIEINLSSKPARGNIANPPTIPNSAESDVVQAGQPGVNAVNAPPNIADVPLFFMPLARCTLIL